MEKEIILVAEQISKLYKERYDLSKRIKEIQGQRASRSPEKVLEAYPLMVRISKIETELEGKILLQGKGPLEKREIECSECHQWRVVNKQETHYLDGNHGNQSHSNIAIVCPCCGTHVLMSPATPKEIWEYKQKGLNNAQIGKILGLSRERVRQLAAQYKPPDLVINRFGDNDKEKTIKYLQGWEKSRYPGKRVTDRRTILKKLEGEIQKNGLS